MYRRSLEEVRVDFSRCVVCCTATALHSRKLLKADYAKGIKTLANDCLTGDKLNDKLEELVKLLASSQQVLLYIFQFIRGYRKKARAFILQQNSNVYTPEYLDGVWQNMCTERMLELQLSSIVSSARSAMATRGAYEEPQGRQVVGEASKRTRNLLEVRGYVLTHNYKAPTEQDPEGEQSDAQSAESHTEGDVLLSKTKEELVKKTQELINILQEVLDVFKDELKELSDI